jgi:hypothetical protein
MGPFEMMAFEFQSPGAPLERSTRNSPFLGTDMNRIGLLSVYKGKSERCRAAWREIPAGPREGADSAERERDVRGYAVRR